MVNLRGDEGRRKDCSEEKGIEVRHEVQKWNEWKTPVPVQAGIELLERSARWMQAGREIAAPKRYWCGGCKPPRGHA